MNINKKLQHRPGKIIGIAASGIAVALIGLGISRLTVSQTVQRKVSSPKPTIKIPKKVEVVGLGRLEPKGEIISVSGPSEELISRLEVSQGDFVKKGEVIAYLESYEERLAERNYIASQLVEAKEKLLASTKYAQAQVQEAQSKILQIDRPRIFEIEAQRATVRQLKVELALEREDLQRLQQLRREGAISQQSLDQQLSKTRQVQEQVNNAQASLIRLQTELKANLSNAQAQLLSQKANLPLTQTQVALKSNQHNLKLAEARLRRSVIRAPRAGQIIRIIAHPGEKIGSDGILEMGNTNQMYAVAEVYEADVGLVKVGQPAKIISRNGAFNKPLTGKVAEIGWQVHKNNLLDDDPAANADARVVEVKIRLDDSKSVKALTNLQVDVRIKL
ncbi:DevB family ABC exporter membrane fusion protein [Calothrix parasitica NIES-267]|uniref:DevB family ABC exporter membrane fusion protein n=1 Tax=Calothrix parasitica NIES-267 TaxID=1973488 RepID=A0A1Z4LT17_9CYAN|nr:DevB family ABC exporter membrane fusion protein [Calothrix parasitica NIES-267]